MTVPVKNRPITAGEFMTWAMRQAEGERHKLATLPGHVDQEPGRRPPRQGGGHRIETRIVRSGPLHLDPPGLTVKVESFFES